MAADEASLGEKFRRCGNCKHAKLGPSKALDDRVCFGVPPTPMGFPAQGGMMIRGIRPPVSVNDPACGQWQLKLGATGPLTLDNEAKGQA